MYCCGPQAEAQAYPLLLGLRRRVKHLLVDPVVSDVELGGIGVEDADHLVASRLARDDAAGRPAQRGTRRRPEEGAFDRGVHVGLGEEGGVMNGDDDRAADPQRHRVVRRMHHFGVDLLGHEREPGLLPRQARRPVGNGRRAGNDRRLRGEPAVALSIGALTDDGQIGVCFTEGGNQAVDVATNAPAVCWNRGGVHEHPGAHGSPHAVWLRYQSPQ